MKNKKMLGFLLTALCAASALSGCGEKTSSSSDSSSHNAESVSDINEEAEKNTESDTAASDHEVITMQSPFRNMSAFIDTVHDAYPDVNIEVIPYSGKNYTAYVKAQLAANDMPDIYCATVYTPGLDKVSDKLIDLSGYSFTDNYTEARLRDVTDNGAIYMLPTYFDCIGITYNKTLLEENGWELPNSFEELEELAVKVKDAGYNLALNEIQLPGYGFQYLCNILSTNYFNTPDGRKWLTAFLNGEATVSGTPELLENLTTLDKWRELGMLNADGDPTSDNDTRLKMAEGNTLFLLGNSNTFTSEETDDQFGIMPYLSEDGTQNALILNVSRYIGLNKKLEKDGNEQKLEDALHIMDVLSTVEGMQALNSTYADTSLLPLKDYTVNSDGYYADIESELNAGMTAPFIYNGWTNLLAPIGETMISYIGGDAEIEDIIRAFDDNQHLLQDNSSAWYTTVSEKIDTDSCAKLVGICYAKACGADLSLISKNKWYKLEGSEDLNLEGVSGALYPLPVTDEEIVSILPAGWRQNIKTVTLTGKRIKELVETGYDRNGDGNTFPYEFVAPDGFTLDDDTVYTVAIAGCTAEVEEEGNITDTGILGLDAAREYFSQFETLSEKDIVWEPQS